MLKFLKIIITINWTVTIRLLLCLPLKDALKFPILAFGRFSIHSLTGKICTVSETVTPGMIILGKSKAGIFDKRAATVLKLDGTIVFKGKASIGKGTCLSVDPGSMIEFGENFKLTGRSSIISSDRRNVIFGKSNLLSRDITIMTADFHHIYEKKGDALLNVPQDIILGDRVWVGFRSILLKGSIIPDDSVIASASVICFSKNMMKTNCIYTGLPVKSLK
jgi:acetyltransferase-like isoleucine patch superfamily enzyme